MTIMKERSRNPVTKKIARERIEILFEQAQRAFSDHPERSNRYVELARRIAMRQRIRIDREFRRQVLPPLLLVPRTGKEYAGAGAPGQCGGHLSCLQ